VNSELRRVPEDDVSEGSTKYHAESAAPHSFSEGEVTRLELDRQLSALLAAQTERDQRIAQLTGDHALKSALLEQAEANATEAKKHEELKLREHQANLDELMLSHDQHVRALERAQSALRKATSRAADADERNHEQIGQYQTELAHVRTNLEAKESELKAVRLRLEDAENALTKSKREADTLRAPAATGFANRDEDQVTHGLMERMRAIEAQMTSKRRNEKSIEPVESNEERWNEKDIESMECSNGG
jgi:chromosome segregation ATPase